MAKTETERDKLYESLDNKLDEDNYNITIKLLSKHLDSIIEEEACTEEVKAFLLILERRYFCKLEVTEQRELERLIRLLS